MGLQEKRRPHQGTTAKQPKAPIRGSTAVSSLDCLLADMESFKSNKGLNSRGRTVEIEVENKKDEELEKKLDNLTDKLLGALQTGTQTPEDGQEKSDLGKCAACGSSIEESAVLAGGETFHQDCFTCTHCQGRLGERFYVVGGLNYCSDHQTVALDSCSGCDILLNSLLEVICRKSVNVREAKIPLLLGATSRSRMPLFW